MEKKIIGLGLLAGALAGSASFLYARTQIAPLIAEAISYEEARSHAAAGGEHAHEHEVFTRTVQENIGAGVGTIMFAIITGALFAVAVSIALATLQRHRITADPRLVAVLVAVGGSSPWRWCHGWHIRPICPVWDNRSQPATAPPPTSR